MLVNYQILGSGRKASLNSPLNWINEKKKSFKLDISKTILILILTILYYIGLPRAATWSRQGSQAKCLKSTKCTEPEPSNIAESFLVTPVLCWVQLSWDQFSWVKTTYRASIRLTSKLRGWPTFQLSTACPPPAIFLSRDARKVFHSASVLRNSSTASWTGEYLYQVFMVSSNFSQESNIIWFRHLYREARPGYQSPDLLEV